MTKFQLTDLEGNVLEETEMIFEENDTLLVEVVDDMPLDIAQKWFNNITNAIDNNADIVAYPSGFKFKVLKKQ